jgi:hypothetical protein
MNEDRSADPQVSGAANSPLDPVVGESSADRDMHLAAKVFVPVVKWCASCIDRVHRRRDRRRSARFWGDEE